MDETPRSSETSRRIDLTRETDVLYWCRIFDVDMHQLREAVHHAGHQADDVQRYLKSRSGGS